MKVFGGLGFYYANIEQECLSVCFGFKKFHIFLYDRDITVQNDHKPLEMIQQKPIHMPRAVNTALQKAIWVCLIWHFELLKDNTMLFGCLHQLKEVSVMVLRGTAVDAYIIMNGNYAWEMVCCLVHSHLKGILGNFQSEWHMQEPVTTTMHVEGG